MRDKSLTILSIVLVWAFVGLITSPGFAAEDVFRISKEKLEKLEITFLLRVL